MLATRDEPRMNLRARERLPSLADRARWQGHSPATRALVKVACPARGHPARRFRGFATIVSRISQQTSIDRERKRRLLLPGGPRGGGRVWLSYLRGCDDLLAGMALISNRSFLSANHSRSRGVSRWSRLFGSRLPSIGSWSIASVGRASRRRRASSMAKPR